MVDLKDVLTQVYELYPRGILLNETTYKKSKEYRNMKMKKEKAKEGGRFVLEKIYQDIKEVFKNYEVLNWSSIEEYPCYEFVILLHKNQPILDDDTDLIDRLNGKRHDLLLYISYITNYYCYYIRETNYSKVSGEWSFKKIRMEDKQEVSSLINKLNVYLTQMGYELLPYEILSHKLPDIDLDLVSLGEATVFHCLFTDMLNFIIKQ